MADIDTALAVRLVSAQFPQWAELPVRLLELQGLDNRTFRLGDTMKLRLPVRGGYAPQVRKEADWLPRLAPHLSQPIPLPIAVGSPGEDYPFEWSVQAWLEGEPASSGAIASMTDFARDLARFLRELRAIDASDGPPAGVHSFQRGGDMSFYSDQIGWTAASLPDDWDAAEAVAIWNEALSSRWEMEPVWVHGDVAAGNLLVKDGRLSGVIDFGCMAVGDPACDLTIAWTYLDVPAREVFRREIGLDDATWARARGWAVWKALITLARDRADHPAKRTLDALLEERH